MRRMASSDHPFKVIHSDPRMVEDTLRGFVCGDWAEHLDFATVAPLGPERVGPTLAGRLQDQVYRVDCREGRLADSEAAHVVVLFEFQSRPDRDMAWRMHEYMYLLELNLRDVGVHRGRMPDMLSVVVYNGDRAWTGAPHRHGPLVGPPTAAGRALNRWRALELIDYHALARGADLFGLPLPPDNRQTALIRLETAVPDEVPGLLAGVFRRYPDAASAGLRRGFHARAQSVLGASGLPPLPDVAECERVWLFEGDETMMLMESIAKQWCDEKIALGREQGVEQGVAQGRMEVLCRLAGLRFGASASTRLAPLLKAAQPARLPEVDAWLMECASADELLARVRALGGVNANAESGAERH